MGNGSEGSGAQVWPPHHTAGMFTFCARKYCRRSGANLIWSGRCSRNALKLRTRASQTPSLRTQFSEWHWIGVGLPPKLAEWWDVLFHSNSHQLSELLKSHTSVWYLHTYAYLTYLKIAVSSLPFRRVPQLHASWGGTLTGCLWLTSPCTTPSSLPESSTRERLSRGSGFIFQGFLRWYG